MNTRANIGSAVARKAALQHVNRIFHSAKFKTHAIELLRDSRLLSSKNKQQIVPVSLDRDEVPTSTQYLQDQAENAAECITFSPEQFSIEILEDQLHNEKNIDFCQQPPLRYIVPCDTVSPSCAQCAAKVSWTDLGKTSFTLSIGNGALLSLCRGCADKSFFSL